MITSSHDLGWWSDPDYDDMRRKRSERTRRDLDHEYEELRDALERGDNETK